MSTPAAASNPGDNAPIFFSFGGVIVAIALGLTLVTQWAGGSLTIEWFAIGAIAPLYPLANVVLAIVPRWFPTWARRISIAVGLALAATYLVVAVVLAMRAHRLYFAGIAFAQVALVWNLARRQVGPGVSALALLLASFAAWVMTAGLSYTSMSNLLMDSARSSGLVAVAFVATLVLVIVDLAANDFSLELRQRNGFRKRDALLLVCVALLFLELSLRTDGLWTDWIPYHRSYFTGAATFLRHGHWLLWDLPSQYGFLSIVVLALTPGATTWESSYLLTAAFLTVQAVMLFVMLRAGRSGMANLLFATLVTVAVFLTDQAYRWPYGPRVYPQHGLRFIWIYALFFIVFQLYAQRSNARATRGLTIAGNTAWSVGCFWSFESAVWCSALWVAYIGTTCVVEAASEKTWSKRLRPFAKLAVLPVIVLLWTCLIDVYYLVRLGHAPDWLSYFEFSALYLSAAPYVESTDRLGPGWMLLLLLGAVGSTILVAIKMRNWSLLPYLVAVWAGTWGTSLYYAGETFNDHVNGIVGFFTFAAATIAYIAFSERMLDGTMFLARMSFVPMFVILLSTWLGDAASFTKMQAPFLPGYNVDVTSGVAPISGELAALMQRAHIKPADKVILPDEMGWTKIDTGLIVPLVREPNGKVREITAWLPVGPAGPFNIFYTLPLQRRNVYNERFLKLSGEAGWYITFHEPAACRVLTSEAYGVGRWNSRNFSVSRCKLRATTLSKGQRD